MKKLLLIAGLALLSSTVFAQDAPANEIYGQVWLDYDLSGAQIGNLAGLPSAVGSDFNFSRMRVGLRDTLADGVKTWFELDPRNLEFRQVNVDWSPAAGLDIIAGKQSKLFARQNDWIFGDRTVGVQARYAIPGIGWAGIIVGNDTPFTNQSSKKIQWAPPVLGAVAITETFVNPGSVMVYPQIAVKPDLGNDISLEAGVNAEINATKQELQRRLHREPGPRPVRPGGLQSRVRGSHRYLVVDNLLGSNRGATGSFTNNSVPNATVMLEVPFNAARDLVIDPFFSYAVSGYNLLTCYVQGLSAGEIVAWPLNDWAGGIRIKYSLSGKF